jgi:Spy/CpxP family protein refolding chaperone
LKTRIALLGLALVSSLALAQSDSAAVDGGKQTHMARMESALGLSDEQVQKMREIRDSGGSMAQMRAVLTPQQQAQAAQMRKDHKAGGGDRKAQLQAYLGLSEEQQAQLAKIRSDGGSRDEMRAVLTPEQLARFDAMRAKHGWKGDAPEVAPAE